MTEKSRPPAATPTPTPESTAALLRELVAHLRQNRTQLREELTLFITRRVWREALGRVSDRDLESLLRKSTDPVSLGTRLARGRRAR